MDDAEGRRLKFEPNVAGELAALYEKQWCRAAKAAGYSADAEAAYDATAVYLGTLEGFAEHAKALAGRLGLQERRRERVEYLASALLDVLEAANNLDDPALGYVLWRGLKEVANEPDATEADRAWVDGLQGGPMLWAVHAHRSEVGRMLAAFQVGVSKSVRELPALDQETYRAELWIARAIEETLERQGIPFSTSETGLAGESFNAVLALAGLPATTAGHWLRKAAKHPGAWRAFIERLKARFRST